MQKQVNSKALTLNIHMRLASIINLTLAQVEKLANHLLKSGYGQYLMSLLKQDRIN